MADRLPVIFSSLGDAGGIGPELAARSLAHPEATAGTKRLIVGHRRLFEKGCEAAGIAADLPVHTDAEEAIASSEPVVFLDQESSPYPDVPYGMSTQAAGATDLAVARHAADLSKAGLIDAFVFAPVNKKSLHMGGSTFEGYKAYIADYLGITAASAEINTIGDLWTTRVTSHIPISAIAEKIRKERVFETIRYFDRELRRFGYANPRILVSGLNPHNGDGGIFGREEIDEIAPAVEEAQKHQINVAGPYPADTIFLTAQEEKALGVVSMYHDQCQIATKLMGFDKGVTYFGGLPFVIATPAHGTAYDIAGQGKANPTPLLNALKLARRAVLAAKGLPVEEESSR